MGVTSVFEEADQGTILAEAERLLDQHEAPTEDMRVLRKTWEDLDFPWPRIAAELRVLIDAAQWHMGGRERAGAKIQVGAHDVGEDVDEVGDLVGVYERALGFAAQHGRDPARAAAAQASFLPVNVRYGGYVGARFWVDHILHHHEQEARDLVRLPEGFLDRVRALSNELRGGRRSYHFSEQSLVSEAGSARAALEGIIERAAQIWSARAVASDHAKRTFPGFDLAYLRGALARRRGRRDEEAVDEPAGPPATAAGALPGLTSD